jgi:hypothetical protein
MVAIAAAAVFIATSFRTGWTQLSTDFPNYYTAAVAVRQGKPLRSYYDWTWFARQMSRSGIDRQLGAYTPQTPLSMLPMVPLAGLPPIDAKRAWLALDLLFLAATVWLLARMTTVRWEYILLLLLFGRRSLAANVEYGQYYIFLLFLIAVTIYSLDRGKAGASGFVSGLAFGLKLYTGPLLLFYAAKRRWSAVAGMLAASALLLWLAISLYGWSDLLHYFQHVLPRTLDGGSIDPYNPGSPTISTFLRRLLMTEPELNPHPMWDAPRLYFAIQSAARLGLIALAFLGAAYARSRDHRRDFAVFVITLLLLSTSVASYSFILLLAPVVLLMDGASPVRCAYLAGGYLLLNNRIGLDWMFPKLWLLLLLFAVAGAELWRSIPKRVAISAGAAILIVSAGVARLRVAEFRQEPGRRYPQIAVEAGALFSGYPAITQDGLFYQGMGDPRRGERGYLLRWAHDGRIDRLSFDGVALEPFALAADGPIWFDLVVNGVSRTMRFDPLTGIAPPEAAGLPSRDESPVSSNGKWRAYTEGAAGSRHLWIENMATGTKRLLAGGACDNWAPAWELDSSAVVFASDCGRAFGLPALYRAPMTGLFLFH